MNRFHEAICDADLKVRATDLLAARRKTFNEKTVWCKAFRHRSRWAPLIIQASMKRWAKVMSSCSRRMSLSWLQREARSTFEFSNSARLIDGLIADG